MLVQSSSISSSFSSGVSCVRSNAGFAISTESVAQPRPPPRLAFSGNGLVRCNLAPVVRGGPNCGRTPMKDEDIARLRLRRQHLTGTPLPTPEAVVGWLGVVQAQEFGVAKWSIAQR